MRDITHKPSTLRSARAISIVFCSESSIDLIKNNKLPKGNLFDVARAAGFIGAKLTPQLLPHCHPVTIDAMDMQFEFLDKHVHAELFGQHVFTKSGIVITGEAKSIGRTGIEMEMLTAVSVAALEIYDMLKPVDTALEIGNIRLLEKKGGKSDRNRFTEKIPVCAVLVCSDSTAAGDRQDKSGLLVKQLLEEAKAQVKHYQILPDNREQIILQLKEWIANDIQFIFTTGGTGFGPKDVTVEAINELIERPAPGIAEAMRTHGQARTPLAMMSRGIAGTVDNTLIVTLPGSVAGARESLQAILPAVFHARKMMEGEGH